MQSAVIVLQVIECKIKQSKKSSFSKLKDGRQRCRAIEDCLNPLEMLYFRQTEADREVGARGDLFDLQGLAAAR
jgi:hypothetical protein